jgi:hypothetical protein
LPNKYDEDSREAVSSEYAFETFSKAGFKPLSSICEIIDNSIEADSNNIIIKFDWNPIKNGGYRKVEKFIFIDDGNGMDKNQIYDYFIATEGDKRDKAKGIGKFGVGAYMSGISQASKCEVFSKKEGEDWLYTILEKGEKIPKPIVKPAPKEYNKFDKGTIVIWSETYSSFTDNDINNDETGDNLLFELGRIYRKFLTETKIHEGIIVDNERIIKITLEVDDNNILTVSPYDPTFLTANPNPGDDTPRTNFQKIKLNVPPHKGVMYATFSFFPEEWWISDKAGNLKVNREKRKIKEPGISLVREDRELYFGTYPGGPIKINGGEENSFISIDRWLGIEIAFSKDADEIFGVEFNKTRIIMEKYARQKISEGISSTVTTHRKNYESKRLVHKNTTGGTSTTGGSGGTTAIQRSIPTPSYGSKEEQKMKEFAKTYMDETEDLEEVYQDLLNGYHISLKYKQSPTAPFVDFAYEANSVIVMYNMDHPFMKQFFEILDQIGQKLGAEPGKALAMPEMEMMRQLLDILLAAFGFSKTQFPDLQKEMVVDMTLNTLTGHWGNFANAFATQNSKQN